MKKPASRVNTNTTRTQTVTPSQARTLMGKFGPGGTQAKTGGNKAGTKRK
jgi:hypothetical protein